MSKMDLSLVPIEDLIHELEKRTSCLIAAYTLPDEQHSMRFSYGRNGDWKSAVGLASILNNDVLNNWDGELKTLQDLHRREGE